MNIDFELVPPDEDIRDMGEHLRQLETARRTALEELTKAQEKQKVGFEKRHKVIEYKKGDKVFIYNPVRLKGVCDKLRKKPELQGEIVEKKSDNTYKVNMGRREELFQIDRLKPFYDPEEIGKWLGVIIISSKTRVGNASCDQ